MLGISIAPDFSLLTISFSNTLQNADGYFYCMVSDYWSILAEFQFASPSEEKTNDKQASHIYFSRSKEELWTLRSQIIYEVKFNPWYAARIGVINIMDIIYLTRIAIEH